MDLGLEIFDWLEVVDFGDAYCPHGQTERSHANIRERVHAVASRGIVPVVLGGDHSITWPSATAVADVHGYGNVGIVHFDAHADTADIIDGNLASHGTPMRRLIESGAVPATHFVQVGLRGYWPPQDTFEWMLEQGMTWHTMQEIWDRGFKAVMVDAVGEALAKADKLYLSVDIDVLDPAFAPGTGTPEPGGIPSSDLLRMVRLLCHRARRGRRRRRRGRPGVRRQRADRQRRPPRRVRGPRRHGRSPSGRGRRLARTAVAARTAVTMSDALRVGEARGRWVLLATVLGSSMAMLDGTVVNLALPRIADDLDASFGGLQWILNGYTLALAALILLGGGLGDRFGRRRIFVMGAVGFTVASLLCAIVDERADAGRAPASCRASPPPC